MRMRWHVAACRNRVDINVDRRGTVAMRVMRQIGQAGFFARFSQGGLGDIALAIQMSAHLQPAIQPLVKMQQRPPGCGVDDEG